MLFQNKTGYNCKNEITLHQIKMTMTEYQAKSNNSLSFDLTQDDKLIGKLSHEKWFKFNAVIEITNNSNYQVEPKGFWGTTIELKDGEKVLLKFKMNWNGEIVVQTYFNDFEKDYIFKQTGFFKGSFILIDQEGIELLVMKPHLKWNKMKKFLQVWNLVRFLNTTSGWNKKVLPLPGMRTTSILAHII